MTYEPPPASSIPPPEPGRRHRRFSRLQKAAIAGGTTIGLAVGGAGIAFAASSSTSTTTPKSTPSSTVPGQPPFGPGPRGGPRFGFGSGFGGPGGLGQLGGAIHGQVTVPNGTNAYKTVEFQVGTVQSVSSSSITVHSADGYTHTYTVAATTVVDSQRNGIGSVTTKDTVSVLATPVAGKDTATNIVDTTKVGSSRTGFGFAPRGPKGSPGSGSTGSGSAGSAGSFGSPGGGFSRFGSSPA